MRRRAGPLAKILVALSEILASPSSYINTTKETRHEPSQPGKTGLPGWTGCSPQINRHSCRNLKCVWLYKVWAWFLSMWLIIETKSPVWNKILATFSRVVWSLSGVEVSVFKWTEVVLVMSVCVSSFVVFRFLGRVGRITECSLLRRFPKMPPLSLRKYKTNG